MTRQTEQRNDEWMTPSWITDMLPHIDLDPCAHSSSTVGAANQYDIRNGDDGLKLPWQGTVFCNPPYTKTSRWLAKCREHGETNQTAIALIPAVPGDGPWMREIWKKATKVGFILGRLQFRNPATNEMVTRGRGHALVVWGPMPHLPPHPRLVWVDPNGSSPSNQIIFSGMQELLTFDTRNLPIGLRLS